VRTVVANDLPRPRDYRSPALLQLVDRLHDIITGMAMPDVPAEQVAPVPTFEPIPAATASEIVGLVEYLDARGGREEVFRIAAETNREFGRLIAVVNAAELLDLVETPKRTVALSLEGQRFVRAGLEERKGIWRERLLDLQLFKQVKAALERQESHQVDRDFVMELIAVNMPSESYEGLFETFVRWARFGDLFSYDEGTGVVALRH